MTLVAKINPCDVRHSNVLIRVLVVRMAQTPGVLYLNINFETRRHRASFTCKNISPASC
jgi:hypothetical protein